MEKIPRQEYPRPQFQRDSYMCLNGTWDFAFDEPVWDRKIEVPYAYQTKLSGIHEKKLYSKVWYRKTFTYEKQENDRVLMHIGAVDYRCRVWVNGVHITDHEGGQTPVDAEITHAVREKNTLVICAEDPHTSFDILRGKQIWKEKGENIFYTSVTGIWQSVWLETVPETYLERVWLTPDIDSQTIKVEYEIQGNHPIDLEIEVHFEGTLAAKQRIYRAGSEGELTIKIDTQRLKKWNFQEELTWSPEHPRLFDIQYSLYMEEKKTDQIRSYFGMRKISVENGNIYLNNRIYYQRLVLNQGYWKDSLWTAPDDEAFVKDIELVKAMGFQGVRMHQKIEDPRFLYHADRLGLLVWEEIGSAYRFSRGYVKRMQKEWMDTIFRDYSHPCIVTWVPLNESWGVPDIKVNDFQKNHSLSLAALTKSLDLTRLVISNDGWEHTDSDICSVHDYEWQEEILKARYSGRAALSASLPAGRPVELKNRYDGTEKPVFLSEFGGISYRKDGLGWGYSHAQSEEELLEKLEDILRAINSSPLIQGFCYTQLTDVEQEMNGLLDFEHIPKIPVEKVRKIFMK